MNDRTTPAPAPDDAPQQSIPYARFKAVNDKYRAALDELATLKAQRPASAPPGDGAPGDPPPAATPAPDAAPPTDTPDYRARWEQARREVDGLKLARLRDRACHAHGIPLELADKLAGTDEATIAADAIRLKAYLRARPAVPSLNGDTPGSHEPIFTIDQISDARFYRANRDAIDRAYAEGRIVR